MGSGKIRAGYGAKPYTLQAAPIHYSYEVAPVKFSGVRRTVYSLIAAALAYGYSVEPQGLVYSPASAGLFPSGPPGGTINYFIGPSGSDSNAGTSVGAPWAITSLISTSSNNSKMAGKNVAFLPGNYPVCGTTGVAGATKIGNGNYPTNGSFCALSIPPGTGLSTRTWIGTCDSNGNYLARTATITLISGQNNSTTNTWFNGIIGRDQTSTVGNVIIDGLRINGNNMDCNGAGDGNEGAHVVFFQSTDGSFTQAGSMGGIAVINCELYSINASDNGGNDALVWLQGCLAPIVQNNSLHDVNKSVQIDHCHAIEAYGVSGGSWNYNTCYNTSGGAFEAKEGCSGIEAAYNYFQNCCYTGGGNAAVFQGWDGAEGNPNTVSGGGAGGPYSIHHNIFDSCGRPSFGESNNANHSMPVHWYSNTLYNCTGEVYLDSIDSASMAHHDNLYVKVSGSNDNQVALSSGFVSPLANDSFYNIAGGSYAAVFSGVTETTGLQTGQDPLFIVGTANIVTGNGTAQFALQSTSPAAGSGTGGINRGAWDGIVTQIGCNFTKDMAPGSYGSFTRLSGGASNISLRQTQYTNDRTYGYPGLAGWVITSVWADWEPGNAGALGGDYTLSAYIQDIQSAFDNRKNIQFKILSYGAGSSPNGVIPNYMWNSSNPLYPSSQLPCYYGDSPTIATSLWRCLYNNPFVQSRAAALCKWILTQAGFSVYVGRTWNGSAWVGGVLTSYTGFNSCPRTTLVNWDEETQPSHVGPCVTDNGYGTRSADGPYYYQASTWATGYETTLAECAAYATTTQFKVPYNQLALYTITESQLMEAAIIQARCCQGAPDLEPSQAGGTLAPGAVPYSNEIGVAAFLGLISSNPPGLGKIPLIAEMEGDDMPGGSLYQGPTPTGSPSWNGLLWMYNYAAGQTVPGGDPAYTAALSNSASQIWYQIQTGGPTGAKWPDDVLSFINAHSFPVVAYTPRIYG